MQKIYQYAHSKTMPLSEIKVPFGYKESTPDPAKVDYVENFYKQYSFLDSPVVVDNKGYIKENYIRYLVAKSHGLKTVPVIVVKAKIHETKPEPVSVTIKLSWRERLLGKLVATV